MSTIKVDTVRPVTTDGSLTLQGDSSGSGVTGITIDSSGNATLNGTANDLGTVTAGTFGSGVTFPTGHITRHFYDEVNPSSNLQVTTSGALYSDLELNITNANTSDYLFVSFFLPQFYNGGASDRTIGVRVRYSTDNWTSPANGQQFGSNETVFVRGLQLSSNTNFFGNIVGSIRAQHPSASYKIRLFLISLTGNVDLFYNASLDESVGNLSALEIKA